MRSTGSSAAIDASVMRRLLVHETRVHSVPGREVRDLGDSILLHDPLDPEPFWNRAGAIRWPTDPDGFDRRLTELMLVFTSLTRQPHVWPAPVHDTPSDLIARLESNGFRDVGGGRVMVLVDPERAVRIAMTPPPPGIRVIRFHGLEGESADLATSDLVSVLVDAFGVDPERRDGIRMETASALAHAAFTYYLVTLDGNPASVARRATFDGATYLSSIGTAPWARGMGLGRLVTATACADAQSSENEWTYLGVFSDNEPAARVYRDVGFAQVGDACPDLLLVG